MSGGTAELFSPGAKVLMPIASIEALAETYGDFLLLPNFN
jgi:hypothetical protein